MKRIISVICLLVIIFFSINAQHKVIVKPSRTISYLKTGVLNSQGDTIVPFIYNDIHLFYDGVACASVSKPDDGKNSSDVNIFWGLIDKAGKETVPFIYRELTKSKYPDRYIATNNEMKKGVIDSKGNVIIPFRYDNIFQFNDYTTLTNSLFFCGINNEGYAVLNKDGKEVNPNRYTNIKSFSNYQRVNYIVELNGKKGLLDYDGKELIPCRYDKIKDHWWWAYESPVPVAINDKWGFADSTGTTIVPCEYKDVNYSFSKNILEAVDDEKRVVFDLQGNTLLSTPKVIYGEYGDKAFFTRESYLTKNHRKSRLAGLVTSDGKNITPFMYERIYRLSDKYFLVSLDDKIYGIIDHRGKMIQPFEYTFSSRQYDRNLVWLVKNGKAGLIDTDKRCKVVIDFEYDNTEHFNYLLSKNGKWGAFDREMNKITIPVVYDSIERVNWDHRKMYCVKKGRKWGIVDSLNNEVLPIEYDNISSIGYISWWTQIKIGKKYGLLNNDYKMVLPCRYDNIRLISPFANWLNDDKKKYAAVSLKGREGVIEISGAKLYDILPIKYKAISYLGDNFFQVQKDKNIGIVDCNNKVIIPYSDFSSIVYSEGVFIVKKQSKRNRKGSFVVETQIYE